jgi:sulfite reductase alpha subunit-like flavoprotein
MAKDVDRALHSIVAAQDGLERRQTENYVQILRDNRRYQRDVY